MAGIKVIEQTLSDAFELLQQAKKLGSDAWRFEGDTLTIVDRNLAAAVHHVLDNTDQAALQAEADDLSRVEILRLVGRLPDLLRRLLD